MIKAQPLKHYAQPYRSGLTMKQKLATDRRMVQDKRQAERDRTQDAWVTRNELPRKI